ncbi:reverse transcriptase [Senna tora]|uniref:Reverse transcriptase n=1 Tax=Senna tora TaxID=362788 RepID=A0A835CK50_9FABA|nr:reverse transcriptase [Senna tora]
MGFWEDRWIPTLSGNKLNDVNGDVNLKVSYVISNGSWDMSKLVGLVSQEELNAILAIPLRSGRVYAAPRVNNFIWRACIEALATNEALVKTRCGIPIVSEYVCANAPEKIEHLLVLCDWAKLAWFCYPLKAFVFLMWGLVGGFRCIFVGNSGRWGVKLSFVGKKLIHFLLLIRQLKMQMSFRWNFSQWIYGWWSGHYLQKCSWGGFGGCAEKLLTCSSLLIEAWALKKAFLLACLKGWERVVFESDCAVLVDAVAGLKGAKTSRPSSCRLVSEEGVKRVVTKDWVFNSPPSLASILTFDVTRSGSNIGDRSSKSCFSAGCAVGCACFREGVG